MVATPAPLQQAAAPAVTVLDAARLSASSPRRIAARVAQTRAASAKAPATTVSHVVTPPTTPSSRAPAPVRDAVALRSLTVPSRLVPTASGWRHTAPDPVDSIAAAAAGLTPPAGGQSNRPAFAAAASSAGAAAAGLLGALALLAFLSLRPGTVVRLRPVWAPAAPFLALLERPG